MRTLFLRPKGLPSKVVLAVMTLVGSLVIAQADSLDNVMARLDVSAKKFRNMAATLTMVTYTDVLKDSSTESGKLQMQRRTPADVRAIVDFSGTEDKRVLFFSSGKVRIYFPVTNAYQDYQIGKNGNLLNQFLLLGFGASGQDLQSGYQITFSGPDVVGGVPSSKLALIPKDSEVLKHLNKIEVWIPVDGDHPIQQKFYETTTGNFRQVSYANFDFNPSFGSKLEFKLPAGARPQQH